MTTLSIARRVTEYYMSKSLPTFLWGPPGVGKSDMVRQIAASRQAQMKKGKKYGIIDFRAVLRDVVDLRGIPAADLVRRKTVWLEPDELPQVERDGEFGVFFMDELNTANSQVQAGCFGLVLDRKLGTYTLPDGWEIIAAGNRQSDRSAAQRMPRALANRFKHIDVEADAKTWIHDYAMENCHELVVSFIRYRPNLIHVMELKDKEGHDIHDERKFPTPRSWAGVSDVCEAPEDILFTAVEGCVGPTAAAEFVGFCKVVKELPDLDEVFANPKRTRVPTEPSAQWMISTSLAKYADRNNFDAALTYAERMSPDYEIVVAMDATKRDPMLTRTKAYIEFAKRNSNVTIGNYKVVADVAAN